MVYFFPLGCLTFIFLILLLPFLFLLGYFHILTIGFEKLGISPQATFFLLLAILIGSSINIPLGRKKIFMKEEKFLFGLFRIKKPHVQGVSINLGGEIIPILLSFYLLNQSWSRGFNLQPILMATLLMIILAKRLARIVPGIGISLPVLIPPLFSALLALVFTPNFAAPTAFIAGTLGTLIGADILNLKRVQKYGGVVSIGGAGVFDGIFLVGIISALLTGI